MASTYVNDLRLNELATGDASGTWGTITNTNLELVAEAFSFGTEGITTNADTHTSTIADGATDPVRSMYVKYTGTLDSACTITIAPNTVSKLWFIENGTSGSQNIIISQGTGANVTIPAGDTKVLYSDGAGSGAAVVDAFASISAVDLKVQDDLTVTDDVIVNGDIDLEGSIDVNGTSNLDVVDIDGALTQDGGAVFNEDSADVDFRVESNGQTHALFVDGALDNIGIGYSAAHTATNKGLVILTGDGNGGIQFNKEDGSYPSSGETLGSIGWKGADSANNNAAAGAAIVGIAAEDFSGSTEATNLAFNTKPSGTGPGSAPTERMRITSDGDFLVRQTSADVYDTNSGSTKREFWGNQFSGSNNTASKTIIGSASNLPLVGGSTQNASSKFIVNSYIGFGSSDQTAGGEDGFMAFYTSSGGAAGTEKMRIDNSGLIGIGSTSPSTALDIAASTNSTNSAVYPVVTVQNTAANSDNSYAALNVKGGNGQVNGFILADGRSSANVFSIRTETATPIQFNTNGSERMRIDSSGNLCLGTTSAFSGSILSVKSRFNSNSGYTVQIFSSDDAEQFSVRGDGAFYTGLDGLSPYNLTTGDNANAVITSDGVLRRSTSSLRYKKDIADATWGLTEVKQLRPVTFKSNKTGEFASDKTHGGFIAEEVHALGLTEFVDYNDSNEPDALHYGNMVALLTKAIQEQQTQIEALQSEINELKNS